ncbi:MAG TPA: hypothetical protein VGK89_04865 [Candidatus Eisenbacteria bacterium]|jgi:hypothetical protein
MVAPRTVFFILALFVAYGASYLSYRGNHVSVSPHGGSYLTYDSQISYFFFRPMSNLDASLTGVRVQAPPP